MAAMPIAQANGIEIAYETFGDPAHPTVLLVMGLGSQMIHWDPEFCQGIVDRGFHVVRFDNRDMGESTRIEVEVDVLGVLSASTSGGEVPPVPYLLSDMAADAVGLLDHLGVDRAHLFGVSMGGMIVQSIAIGHPERVITLTSVMSTTGDPDVGTPEARGADGLGRVGFSLRFGLTLGRFIVIEPRPKTRACCFRSARRRFMKLSSECEFCSASSTFTNS